MTNQQLADKVARLVVNEGYAFDHAVYAATEQLGLSIKNLKISRQALSEAVNSYRGLFRPEQNDLLKKLRKDAVQAMLLVEKYQPKLFGDTLEGLSTTPRLNILLNSDSTEEVAIHLSDKHIPWKAGEKQILNSRKLKQAMPSLYFYAGQTRVEYIIGNGRLKPYDSLSQKPMRLANIEQLRGLT